MKGGESGIMSVGINVHFWAFSELEPIAYRKVSHMTKKFGNIDVSGHLHAQFNFVVGGS
jgi:hypothetical protein